MHIFNKDFVFIMLFRDLLLVHLKDLVILNMASNTIIKAIVSNDKKL